MDPDDPDLLALQRRLEREEKDYAEALGALDALATFDLPQEKLPEMPDLLARLLLETQPKSAPVLGAILDTPLVKPDGSILDTMTLTKPK